MKLDLIKLSHYNIPHLVENSRNDWISFGEDNLYPNYLLELFLGSAINGALIKSIGAMIYGEGLAATNADETTDTKESYLRLTELLHNSDDDVLKDLAMDLKLFGGCYVNVIWSRDRSKIAKMKHIPAQYIRSGKMIDGEIENYYYSADWSKVKKSQFKPRAYAAFNTEDRTQASQILMIRDKNPALFYGFAPDYVAATDWIQMELEIAQFHLSNITSGMTPSMHVGFSNGVPTDEERRTIERQLNAKFAGSGNAGKILITFNDGKETAPIIEPIQMNDAQSAWEGMSKQAVNQILAGHRVTSPILFGIRAEGGGLGNNADELRDAFSLFSNTVVIPFQNTLLKGLEKIFRVNDINLDLYFKSLKPADFIDLEVTKTQSEEDQEKEGVTKEDINTEDLVEMSDDDMNNMLEYLGGEQIDLDKWEVVDEQDEGLIEDYQEWADSLIKHLDKKEFADEITAKPDGFSYLDKSYYKVRFKYFKKSKRTRTPNGKNPIGKSRTFCKNMMRLAGQGTVYRIEDIDKASREGVNQQFGHKGRKYDLFKYKGGVYCTHAFSAVLYRLKANTELVEGQPLEDYKKVSSIPKTYEPKPRGIKESKEAANRGNNWWKYPGAKN
tara:strand:- start:2145 stop:3983 length:1839 start_codon:yes stop_codon:yes gene_type:complete